MERTHIRMLSMIQCYLLVSSQDIGPAIKVLTLKLHAIPGHSSSRRVCTHFLRCPCYHTLVLENWEF